MTDIEGDGECDYCHDWDEELEYCETCDIVYCDSCRRKHDVKCYNN